MQTNRRPRARGSKNAPSNGRRTRVAGGRNHHLYTRTGGALEIGYRDSAGKQRWKTLPPGTTITQARGERDSILAAKSRGEVVRPTPRLRFGDALDRWLSDQVTDLRPNTQAMYRNAARNHLRPRWGNRRMDTLDVDDAARLVRDLRDRGLADSTIHGILVAASRVLKFARRRMG